MNAIVDTVTLPKDFIDQLISTVHAHADALHKASELSANNDHQSLKRLTKKLDRISGELFDIAMTVKVTAYGTDETIVCGANEDMTAFSDDIGVINDNWRFSS